MDEIEYTARGNWLRWWRKRRRMSQTALAERVGVDQSTVGKWERGAHTMIRHLDKLSQVLDVPPERIMFGPQQPAYTSLPPGEPGFFEDAEPWHGDIPGIRLDLGPTETPYRVVTDAVCRARGGAQLTPGDIAIFDIGGEAMARFRSGHYPDGTVVIAQVHDDDSGTAATILRQWSGDSPGVLYTNRPDRNEIVSLLQHGEITVMGVLSRSLRSHALPAQPRRLPAPDRGEGG